MGAPFKEGNYVKTIKGAKFRGRVVSIYRVDRTLEFVGLRVRHPDIELPPEWRVDVMAVHPQFAGTIHVYPSVELELIAETDLDFIGRGPQPQDDTP